MNSSIMVINIANMIFQSSIRTGEFLFYTPYIVPVSLCGLSYIQGFIQVIFLNFYRLSL